jgi:DNA-binding response OmpR family regulator
VSEQSKILFVEDNVELAEILDLCFKAHGFAVEIVSRGKEAIPHFYPAYETVNYHALFNRG